ncbi:MAG: hypothetical protein Q9157_000200 [Trypethelium eluteriae]
MSGRNQDLPASSDLSNPGTTAFQLENQIVVGSSRSMNTKGCLAICSEADMDSTIELEEGEIEEGKDTDILEDESYLSDDDSMDVDSEDGSEEMSMDDLEENEVRELTEDAAPEMAWVREKQKRQVSGEVVHITPYPDRDMELVRRYVHRGGETFCEVYFRGREIEEDIYKLISVSPSEIDLVTLPEAADVEGEQYLVNETNPLPGQWRPYFHGGYHTGCALFHHKTTYRYPALELLQPGERPFFAQPAGCQSRHHPGPPPRNPQEHSFFTISEVYPDFAQRKLDGDRGSIIDVIEWLTRMPGRTEFSFVTTKRKGISIFRIKLASHFMRHPFDMVHEFELTQAEWDALPAQSRNEAVAMEEAAFAMDFRALEHKWYDRRLKSLGWEGGLQWIESMDDAELFNFVEWHYNCTELYELSTDRAWHEVVYQLEEHGMQLPEFPWKQRMPRIPVSEVLLKKVEIIHPSELRADQTQCGICTTDFAQLEEFPAKFNCRCGAIFGLACLLDWHRDIQEGTVKTCPICRDAMYTQDEVVNDLYPVWQNSTGVEWNENNKDLDWGLYPRLIPWDFRSIHVNAAQLVLAFKYVFSMSTDIPAKGGRTPEYRYHPVYTVQYEIVSNAWRNTVRDCNGRKIHPQDLFSIVRNYAKTTRPQLGDYARQFYERAPGFWKLFGDIDAPWSYWKRMIHRAINFYKLRGISPSANGPEAVELDGDFCVRTLRSNDIVEGGLIYRVFFNKDRWDNDADTDDAWNAWIQWRDDWTARNGYVESLDEDL